MLVDLETAKRHLRRDDDDDDERIMLVVEQASDIILDYLKLPEGTYQSTDGGPDVVPKLVTAAVLLCVEGLYDEPVDSFGRPSMEVLSDQIKNILHRHRDPAMA